MRPFSIVSEVPVTNALLLLVMCFFLIGTLDLPTVSRSRVFWKKDTSSAPRPDPLKTDVQLFPPPPGFHRAPPRCLRFTPDEKGYLWAPFFRVSFSLTVTLCKSGLWPASATVRLFSHCDHPAKPSNAVVTTCLSTYSLHFVRRPLHFFAPTDYQVAP